MSLKFVRMKDLKERTRWVFTMMNRKDVVVVTKDGMPAGILQPMEEGFLEAVALSQSAEYQKTLGRARAQVERGDVVRFEVAGGRLVRRSARS